VRDSGSLPCRKVFAATQRVDGGGSWLGREGHDRVSGTNGASFVRGASERKAARNHDDGEVSMSFITMASAGCQTGHPCHDAIVGVRRSWAASHHVSQYDGPEEARGRPCRLRSRSGRRWL
jgi:hypothetical protein